MNFNPALVDAKGSEVQAIEGFANGSFSLRVKEQGKIVVKLFDAHGKEVCSDIFSSLTKRGFTEFYRGAVLGENKCILMPKENISDYFAVWAEKGQWYASSINDVFIFANDWYMTSAFGTKMLYAADGKEKAKWFDKAEVFNLGFAIAEDKNKNEWRLFSTSGLEVRKAKNVAAFLGDGNMLVYSEEGKTMSFQNFWGRELIKKPIKSFEKFSNGYFVLEFVDGLSRMYYPNGKVLSVEVGDVSFMSDGSFVHFEGKIISGVYGRRGILDKREIYSFEKAGNYYLFSGEFYNGHLYNSDGKKVGEDYILLKSQDNFALLEHEDELKLFNQYGCVFRMTPKR